MGLGRSVGYRGKLQLKCKVYGVPAMVQDLKYMREQIADGLQAAVHAGAAEFEAEAKSLVPVLTGKLRDSIHIEIVQSDSNTALAVVGPDDSVEYAAYVEYGTRHMKEEPYMRPAYENAKDRAAAALQEVLMEEIRQVLSLKGGGS